MLRRKNRLPKPVSFNSNNLEQKSHTDHVCVSKLCLYATGNSGSVFLLSFACTPKLWKKQSHDSTLASTFSFVAYCEPLPMNLCHIFSSLKLMGSTATPSPPGCLPLLQNVKKHQHICQYSIPKIYTLSSSPGAGLGARRGRI